MFERQWFPPNSQLGLKANYLEIDQLIYKNELDKALARIHQLITEDHNFYSNHILNRINHLQNRCSKSINIFYYGFWEDMDVNNCQLSDLLSLSASKSISVVNNPSQADISIFSCYKPITNEILKETDHTFRILFLGENVRPNYSFFDFTITSDASTYSGKNLYFPLIFFEVDWFNKRAYQDRTVIPKRVLYKQNIIDHSVRYKKIAFVGNNMEPVRCNLINQLIASGIEVDMFGSQTTPVNDKFSLLSKYSFSLCPENSYFNGYVTEKLVQSYIAGCICIYWGSYQYAGISSNSKILNIDPVDTKSSIEAIKNKFKEIEKKSIQVHPSLWNDFYLDKFINNVVEKLSLRLSQFN